MKIENNKQEVLSFDFRKLDNLSTGANNKEKRKITNIKNQAFIIIALSFFITIGIGSFLTKYSAFKHNTDNLTEQTSTKQTISPIGIDKIKTIDQAHFEKFIAYLMAHENLYDQRLLLIKNSLLAAEKEDPRRAANPDYTIKNLEHLVYNYKIAIATAITQSSEIYQDSQERIENHTTNFSSSDDIQKFIDLYEKYETGVVLENITIEQSIKDILYTTNPENKNYNQKHDLFNTDQKLSQENTTIIKKIKP